MTKERGPGSSTNMQDTERDMADIQAAGLASCNYRMKNREPGPGHHLDAKKPPHALLSYRVAHHVDVSNPEACLGGVISAYELQNIIARA